MKNDTGDNEIKRKVDGLDTLSGGVVFGKEDAWEKLQTRMDGKPVRVLPVRYTMLAAAALLLLFICITTVYLHPSAPVANVTPSVPVNTNSIVAAPPQQPVTVQQQTQVVTAATKQYTRKQKEKSIPIPAPHEPAFAQIPTDKKIPAAPVTVNTPAPVTLPEQMNVVHINELENTAKATPVVTDVYSAADVEYMKVVHIFDVEKEEKEVRSLRHDNRFSFGRNPFSRPAYNDNNTGAEEYHQPRNFLKTIRNTQN